MGWSPNRSTLDTSNIGALKDPSKMMEHSFNRALSVGSVVRLMTPGDIEGALDGQVVTLRDGQAVASFGEWPEWYEAWAVTDLAYDTTNDTWTPPGSGRITYPA